VVNKVGLAVGVNCRILSGSFGTARWSNDYSQLTTRHGLLHAGLLFPPRCLTLSFCQGFTPFLGLESKKRLTFRSHQEIIHLHTI
jgi:hypothetical protein